MIAFLIFGLFSSLNHILIKCPIYWPIPSPLCPGAVPQAERTAAVGTEGCRPGREQKSSVPGRAEPSRNAKGTGFGPGAASGKLCPEGVCFLGRCSLLIPGSKILPAAAASREGICG